MHLCYAPLNIDITWIKFYNSKKKSPFIYYIWYGCSEALCKIILFYYMKIDLKYNLHFRDHSSPNILCLNFLCMCACTHVHACGTILWSIGNLPVATFSTRMALPHPKTIHSPIAPQYGVWPGDHLPICTRVLSGLILYRLCASNHSYWKLMYAKSMSCPEDSIL